MPEPLKAISIKQCYYIFMLYIKGVTLAEVQLYLMPYLKTFVQSQLREILQCLRKVLLQLEYLRSSDPLLCRDIQRYVWISLTSISTKTKFNAFLTFTQRELNLIYQKLLTSKLSTGHRIVMTYSNIRCKNVLVLYTALYTINITGLIDQEVSRAYLEYQEYVKALNKVNCNLSDQYLYLPTDVIGDHSNAQR